MTNKVFFQSFSWDSPSDGSFYQHLAARAEELARLGVGAVWLPPAMKGSSDFDVGYTAYDIWDLGEFDQHGSVRTKYGTREELQDCVRALKGAGIQVFADLVYNHKGGADYSEICAAVPVNPENRAEEIGEPRDIEAWTGFNFPGRAGKYSDFVWNFNHFTGVDYDQRTGESGIFKILGENKDWAEDADSEKGNFDYLMNADINHSHPDVRRELIENAKWLVREIGYDGFRFDALKHISTAFIDELVAALRADFPDLQFIGEYWQGSEETLRYYLDASSYQIQLFDVPLHFKLQAASHDPDYELGDLLTGTLVAENPLNTVTFVDNHDSQPGQSLESWVAEDFREFANALILLRRDGYPCIFAGDLEGLPETGYPGLGGRLTLLLELRRDYAYGEEEIFLADSSALGLIRHGNEEHPGKLIMAYCREGERDFMLELGPDFAGQRFQDRSNQEAEIVIEADSEGRLCWRQLAGQISYWVSL